MNFIGKTLKKKLTLITLAVVVFCTGIFTVGGISSKKAYALSPETNDDPYTIYYFTDYYPTLTHYELSSIIDAEYIVYDRQSITESDFNDMVLNGYFFGFNNKTIVIIDIKTFKPNPGLLVHLFSELQQNQGCKTAFVTVYDERDYDDTSFLNYLNIFIDNAKLTTLEKFVEFAIDDFAIMNNDTVDSTTYLIESNLVNVNHYDSSIEELCSTSPFLRFLLEQLAIRLDISYSSSYEEIAESLRVDHHIKLLVQTGDDEFVDILTWYPYHYSDINWLMHEGTDTEFACAFGFWLFNDNYYQILYNIQNNEYYDIPVYALIIDSVDYDSDGLRIIAHMANGDDDAAQRLLEALRSLLI